MKSQFGYDKKIHHVEKLAWKQSLFLQFCIVIVPL